LEQNELRKKKEYNCMAEDNYQQEVSAAVACRKIQVEEELQQIDII
jgi:hypothetical protein